MADTPKTYDSTIMRMAGNIAAGFVHDEYTRIQNLAEDGERRKMLAAVCVDLARAIVAEVQRTSDGVAPRKDGQ